VFRVTRRILAAECDLRYLAMLPKNAVPSSNSFPFFSSLNLPKTTTFELLDAASAAFSPSAATEPEEKPTSSKNDASIWAASYFVILFMEVGRQKERIYVVHPKSYERILSGQ